MKKTGASLARHALEQIGVKFTFGIPGVHNTELYDELYASETIEPVLVAHEGGGSFMADAISRTSDSIGTMLIVPAAGVTHASSGIGEAGLDGVPMLIISGGIHTESGHKYQLHDIDQHTLLGPITKGTYHIRSHAEVIPTIYEAYKLAISGEPGPVFVELPYNIANFLADVDEIPNFVPDEADHKFDAELVWRAAKALVESKQPGIFVGWGGVDCHDTLTELATWLSAPVCTTLQGLSAFPANHPLHVGMGFGPYAVPAAENAFKGVDCLLAIGTRFSEIPTGSYSMPVPENLVHIDINPEVFSANFPAKVKVPGDAKAILPALLAEVKKLQPEPRDSKLPAQIQRDKQGYLDDWLKHNSKGRVNPAVFCQELRKQLKDDAIVVADDGNHTFLLAELMPIYAARGFISPSDFNAMGYCVPATIGAKLSNPNKQVVGVVGDGALRMTGLEMITASALNVGAPVFVFEDGELSQISQAQQIPYNRKVCTVLKPLNIKALAEAVSAEYILINSNEECRDGIAKALALAAENKPVYVEVSVDYSRSTRFTKGIVKATLKRFTTRDKVHSIGRAVWRRIVPN